MRSDFDPLRSTPLPESFDRTAEWLRQAPPPRVHRAPAVALVALLVLIGAWSWPVQTTVAAGSVIEVLSATPIEDDDDALRTLDRLVPDEHQHLVELDDADEENGTDRLLRYAVLGANPTDVDRWRDSVAALPSTRAARVLMIDVTKRRPFGVVTARRVLGVNTTPHLTDAELQSELDRVFAQAGSISIRVERTPEGQRRLQVGEHLSLDVRPSVRVSPVPSMGGNAGGVVIRGSGVGSATIGGQSLESIIDSSSEASFMMTLDSLPPEAARVLRDHLDKRLRDLDSLRVSSSVPGDSIRTHRMFFIDSLSLPPGARTDTLVHSIRIHSARDSL